MIINIDNLDDTKKTAKKFADMLRYGDVVSMTGDLGAGKTAFTRFVAKELGLDAEITSPTFNIVNRYPLENGEFFHVDLYRLEEEELETVDCDAFLYPDGISFIEWADRAPNYMPKNRIRLTFSIEDDGRVLTLAEKTPREREIVREWKNECSKY